MPKYRRVVFSFDDRSLESLEKMNKQGRVPGNIQSGMKMHSCFPTQEPTEFRELVVRNPETGEERVICIPKVG